MKTDYLHLGDCVDFMRTLPDDSIDLIVTSPPYDDLRVYGNHAWDFKSTAIQIYRIMKVGGVVVWVVDDSYRKDKKGSMSLSSFKQALFFDRLGFNVHDNMIWDRHSMRFPRSNGYYRVCQYMMIFSKNASPKTFNPLQKFKPVAGRLERYQSGWISELDKVKSKRLQRRKSRSSLTNIWKMYVGYNHSTKDKYTFQHPATFPEELAKRHILSWSNVGDVVLDPMCGSGTTCKMAKLLRRKYLGCEAHEPYYDISMRRLNEQNNESLDQNFSQF